MSQSTSEKRPRRKRQWLRSIGSALGSAGVTYVFFPLPLTAIIIVVLVSHELGHVGAARLVGADASAPLFIPLFVFVVGVTRIRGVPQEYKGLVAVAGPATGAGIALGLLLLSLIFGVEVMVLASLGALLMEFWSAVIGSDGRKYRRARSQR